MQYQQGDYTVVSAAPLGGRVATEVPDALRDRFYGKRFTRQELEATGVEIRGDRAVVVYDGAEWELQLTPAL
jgi:hypothetical protein